MIRVAKSWKVVPVDFGLEIVDSGIPIAILCTGVIYDEYEYANLIAAAPDLLALVEQVEWWNTKCPWCYGDRLVGGHRSDCPRQAALAKVRGKPSS